MFRGQSIAPIVILLLLQVTGYGQLLGDSVDVSDDFTKNESTYFVPDSVTKFDENSGTGTLRWSRFRREYNISFNKHDTHFVRAESNEFPATEYDRDPELPFAVDFISPGAVRLRFSSRAAPLDERQSLILAQYNLWRRSFGTPGAGAGSSSQFGAAVPEPAPGLIAIIAVAWPLIVRVRTNLASPIRST